MRLSKLVRVLSVAGEDGVSVVFNGVCECVLAPDELETLIEFLSRPGNPNVSLSEERNIVAIEMDFTVFAILSKMFQTMRDRVVDLSGFKQACVIEAEWEKVDARNALRYWREIDGTVFERAVRLLVDSDFLERHPEIRRNPETSDEEDTHRCQAPLMHYRAAEIPVHGTLFLFERHVRELMERREATEVNSQADLKQALDAMDPVVRSLHVRHWPSNASSSDQDCNDRNQRH